MKSLSKRLLSIHLKHYIRMILLNTAPAQMWMSFMGFPRRTGPNLHQKCCCFLSLKTLKTRRRMSRNILVYASYISSTIQHCLLLLRWRDCSILEDWHWPTGDLRYLTQCLRDWCYLKVTNLLTIDVITIIIDNVLFNYPLYIFHEVWSIFVLNKSFIEIYFKKNLEMYIKIIRSI